jgi:hypothetical protein
MSLCTKTNRERICEHLRKGAYLSEAARAVGIAPVTVKVWMKKGLSEKPQDRPYRMFRRAVERAQGEAAATLVGYVHDAAAEDWKAAMALLSARYPKKWGRRPRTVVLQSNTNMIGQDMPQEELNRLFLDILKNPEITKGLPPAEQKLLLSLAKELPTAQQEVIADAEFSDSSEGSDEGRSEFHPQGLDEVSEGSEDGSALVGADG